MYLIPLIRTSRAITACTILPNNPIIAVSISEIISYVLPFINNSFIYAFNDMILFLFYYYYYNESAIQIIQKYKNKYINFYKLEFISIFIYLLLTVGKISF